MIVSQTERFPRLRLRRKPYIYAFALDLTRTHPLRNQLLESKCNRQVNTEIIILEDQG